MTAARSFRTDNAKALLILLVVWGHLLEEAAFEGGVSRLVYGTIYLFHMPAFVLISGAMSKPALGRAGLIQMARRILRPLAVFQLLYWPVLHVFAPYKLGGVLAPHWILWFLLSLATWRLLLPLFLRLRYPVLSALLLTLALGFWTDIGTDLSLSRTFYFFPAFLFGHLYAGRIVAWLQLRPLWSALGAAAILGVGVWALLGGLPLTMLSGSEPYRAGFAHWGVPVGLRLGLIVMGIALSVLLLALVPDRPTFFSELGRETLPVYLLHGFAVVLFWWLVAAAPSPAGTGFLALTLVLAVLLSVGIALASRQTDRLLRKCARAA
ncbi:acyltransferase family protein [Pseudothioclava arenosa]|uniref:Acyltransferase 3 domain-containing protein n=1 Tax=Pseudothioclava arenosa TaxID=1795308 RepID=A0A2A4CMA0_9RHOB|nr:acyltransferase family protein [Pseudothioclava arenosa]PCD75617.1 hypothetical protein CLN94_13330 [Pseudothioclava arenosa]